MGILHDKGSPFDFPPGTPMGLEERDRFGLPMQGGSFLGEDERQFNERMAATEAFVRDAVEAVIRQVDDHKVAERMFLEEFGYRRPRRKSPGRPPDKEKNAAMLAEWKRQKDLGLSTHHATCAAADELEFAQKGKKKVKGESLERRLRRQREKLAKLAEAARSAEAARLAYEEYLKKLPSVWFEEIGSELKADI
jgi:hypothetical protein